MSRDFAIDAPALEQHLVEFLRAYAKDARADGYVIGLSGGIDSAVSAALAARAVGPERVLGLLMPHASSNPQDEADGRLVGEHLGVELKRAEVTPIVDAVAGVVGDVPGFEGMAVGNVKARARMILNYAHANALNRLVLGTGNKSELLIGYFTKYGDGGADVYPIAGLFKTEVRALARHLGLPDRVIEKAPSAGLFEGQTDEGEIGVAYADLDRILAAFEAGRSVDEVARDTGVPVERVRDVQARMHATVHKRDSLVVPDVPGRGAP